MAEKTQAASTGTISFGGDPISSSPSTVCRNCGHQCVGFGLTCEKCHTPVVRAFGFLFTMQILVFLLVATLLSLADSGYLSNAYLRAPMYGVGQLVVLYLLYLSTRQLRFVIPLILYVFLLIAAHTQAQSLHLTVSVALTYIPGGAAVIWASRLRPLDRWARVLTAWYTAIVVLWSFSLFCRFYQDLLPCLVAQRHLLPVRGPLVDYPHWGAVGGLLLTLLISSAVKTGKRGITVREDYYEGARLEMPAPMKDQWGPAYIYGMVLAVRAVACMAILFFNTIVIVLNLITRSFVIAWQIVVAFVAAFLHEIRSSDLLGYLAAIGRRVVLPFCAMALAALITIELADIVRSHAFSPSIGSALGIVWRGGVLCIAMLACVVFLGRWPLQQALNTYCGDLAILVGYGLPALLLCLLILLAVGEVVKWATGVELGFRIGPLSWGIIGLLGLTTALLWRQVYAALVDLLENTIKRFANLTQTREDDQ